MIPWSSSTIRTFLSPCHPYLTVGPWHRYLGGHRAKLAPTPIWRVVKLCKPHSLHELTMRSMHWGWTCILQPYLSIGILQFACPVRFFKSLLGQTSHRCYELILNIKVDICRDCLSSLLVWSEYVSLMRRWGDFVKRFGWHEGLPKKHPIFGSRCALVDIFTNDWAMSCHPRGQVPLTHCDTVVLLLLFEMYRYHMLC